MKSLEEYLALSYTIETKKESDGSYFIKVKELPGCMSVGADLVDAYAMIEDAMAVWIQSRLDGGQAIPLPEDESAKSYSGRFVVRITPQLHRRLAEIAKEQGVSLNHLVTELLSGSA
ncbi:MAG: type II toxin-antitoxin system HicB family antitoxin [Sphaerochaeta sp.]